MDILDSAWLDTLPTHTRYEVRSVKHDYSAFHGAYDTQAEAERVRDEQRERMPFYEWHILKTEIVEL